MCILTQTRNINSTKIINTYLLTYLLQNCCVDRIIKMYKGVLQNVLCALNLKLKFQKIMPFALTIKPNTAEYLIGCSLQRTFNLSITLVWKIKCLRKLYSSLLISLPAPVTVFYHFVFFILYIYFVTTSHSTGSSPDSSI